ncbi:MAG: sodium-dependent transporter [Paludibacteraceae bacterium]|nr:sodium-dependent transporter [Paludibacteraceae bacterium]
MQNRTNFATKLGVILATVGSSVGLGNIWRFPFEAGRNGGSAFILIYVGCVLLLGIPCILAEFLVGRRSHANPVEAFGKLAPRTPWYLVGLMGIFTGFCINGFYCVVTGWTFSYFLTSLRGSFFEDGTDYSRFFTEFSTGTWQPILWAVLAMLAVHWVVSRGVRKGIEMSGRILMPVLFLLLLVLGVRGLFMPGAAEGLRFLFMPDFSGVTATTVLSALGQAFFSLSVGMGALLTYSSYFSDEVSLEKTAYQVAGLDTLVAILAGIVVFPAVFSFGIQPSAGPGLVFVTMPEVFAGMPLSNLWSSLFYLLLAIAALTSSVSLHEAVVAFISEHFELSRRKASLFVLMIVVCMGALCSLSIGVLGKYTLGGRNFFDMLDFLTSAFLLPFGGLLTTLFVGWKLGPASLQEELSSHGRYRVRLIKVYLFLIRFVAPICILAIFLFNLLM